MAKKAAPYPGGIKWAKGEFIMLFLMGIKKVVSIEGLQRLGMSKHQINVGLTKLLKKKSIQYTVRYRAPELWGKQRISITAKGVRDLARLNPTGSMPMPIYRNHNCPYHYDCTWLAARYDFDGFTCVHCSKHRREEDIR